MDGFNEYVGGRVGRLQGQLLHGDGRPAALQHLAELRRARPDDPGQPLPPVVWPLILEGLPPQARGRDEDLSRWEWAAVTALALYAWHQQSLGVGMHRPGQAFGVAVRRLAQPPGAASPAEPVVRRFNQVLTADGIDGVHTYTRGLITMLRGAALPVDYGRLANDLAGLAASPAQRVRVQTRWSREFAHVRSAAATS